MEKTCSISLKTNDVALRLYLEFPFFPYVLRWLTGHITFEEIPQFDNFEYFSKNILPIIRSNFIRLKFLKFYEGKWYYTVDDLTLVDIPEKFVKKITFNNYIQAISRNLSHSEISIQADKFEKNFFIKIKAPQPKVI